MSVKVITRAEKAAAEKVDRTGKRTPGVVSQPGADTVDLAEREDLVKAGDVYISKSQYESLGAREQRLLRELGPERYQKVFKATHVEVGEGEWIHKDKLSALPESHQDILKEKGTKGYADWVDAAKETMEKYTVEPSPEVEDVQPTGDMPSAVSEEPAEGVRYDIIKAVEAGVSDEVFQAMGFTSDAITGAKEVAAAKGRLSDYVKDDGTYQIVEALEGGADPKDFEKIGVGSGDIWKAEKLAGVSSKMGSDFVTVDQETGARSYDLSGALEENRLSDDDLQDLVQVGLFTTSEINTAKRDASFKTMMSDYVEVQDGTSQYNLEAAVSGGVDLGELNHYFGKDTVKGVVRDVRFKADMEPYEADGGGYDIAAASSGGVSETELHHYFGKSVVEQAVKDADFQSKMSPYIETKDGEDSWNIQEAIKGGVDENLIKEYVGSDAVTQAKAAIQLEAFPAPTTKKVTVTRKLSQKQRHHRNKFSQWKAAFRVLHGGKNPTRQQMYKSPYYNRGEEWIHGNLTTTKIVPIPKSEQPSYNIFAAIQGGVSQGTLETAFGAETAAAMVEEYNKAKSLVGKPVSEGGIEQSDFDVLVKEGPEAFTTHVQGKTETSKERKLSVDFQDGDVWVTKSWYDNLTSDEKKEFKSKGTVTPRVEFTDKQGKAKSYGGKEWGRMNAKERLAAMGVKDPSISEFLAVYLDMKGYAMDPHDKALEEKWAWYEKYKKRKWKQSWLEGDWEYGRLRWHDDKHTWVHPRGKQRYENYKKIRNKWIDTGHVMYKEHYGLAKAGREATIKTISDLGMPAVRVVRHGVGFRDISGQEWALTGLGAVGWATAGASLAVKAPVIATSKVATLASKPIAVSATAAKVGTTSKTLAAASVKATATVGRAVGKLPTPMARVSVSPTLGTRAAGVTLKPITVGELASPIGTGAGEALRAGKIVAARVSAAPSGLQRVGVVSQPQLVREITSVAETAASRAASPGMRLTKRVGVREVTTETIGAKGPVTVGEVGRAVAVEAPVAAGRGALQIGRGAVRGYQVTTGHAVKFGGWAESALVPWKIPAKAVTVRLGETGGHTLKMKVPRMAGMTDVQAATALRPHVASLIEKMAAGKPAVVTTPWGELKAVSSPMQRVFGPSVAHATGDISWVKGAQIMVGESPMYAGPAVYTAFAGAASRAGQVARAPGALIMKVGYRAQKYPVSVVGRDISHMRVAGEKFLKSGQALGRWELFKSYVAPGMGRTLELETLYGSRTPIFLTKVGRPLGQTAMGRAAIGLAKPPATRIATVGRAQVTEATSALARSRVGLTVKSGGLTTARMARIARSRVASLPTGFERTGMVPSTTTVKTVSRVAETPLSRAVSPSMRLTTRVGYRRVTTMAPGATGKAITVGDVSRSALTLGKGMLRRTGLKRPQMGQRISRLAHVERYQIPYLRQLPTKWAYTRVGTTKIPLRFGGETAAGGARVGLREMHLAKVEAFKETVGGTGRMLLRRRPLPTGVGFDAATLAKLERAAMQGAEARAAAGIAEPILVGRYPSVAGQARLGSRAVMGGYGAQVLAEPLSTREGRGTVDTSRVVRAAVGADVRLAMLPTVRADLQVAGEDRRRLVGADRRAFAFEPRRDVYATWEDRRDMEARREWRFSPVSGRGVRAPVGVGRVPRVPVRGRRDVRDFVAREPERADIRGVSAARAERRAEVRDIVGRAPRSEVVTRHRPLPAAPPPIPAMSLGLFRMPEMPGKEVLWEKLPVVHEALFVHMPEMPTAKVVDPLQPRGMKLWDTTLLRRRRVIRGARLGRGRQRAVVRAGRVYRPAPAPAALRRVAYET